MKLKLIELLINKMNSELICEINRKNSKIVIFLYLFDLIVNNEKQYPTELRL
jgi:hypothetical protein